MYDDVLLPVAIGELDENPTIEYGLDLAERYDATVHLVSAVDPTVSDPMTTEIGHVHEALEGDAQATVENAADRARERGLDVTTRVGHGSPHTVITQYAGGEFEDADGTDIVVMATHGRDGIEHALLGSVTEKVVRTAPVPVLTVPL